MENIDGHWKPLNSYRKRRAVCLILTVRNITSLGTFTLIKLTLLV